LEAEEDFNNDFFNPKGIKQRIQKQEEERKKFLSKVEAGLKNIKNAYKDKDWKSEPERLFLEIFSTLHLDKKYDKKWNGCYLLRTKNNERRIIWDSINHVVWISSNYIWEIIEKQFELNYSETRSFMKDILKKYFKLRTFTPAASGWT
jgi:hypothetical protein